MKKIILSIAAIALMATAAHAQNQDRKNRKPVPSRVTTEQPAEQRERPTQQMADPIKPDNAPVAQPVPPSTIQPVSTELNSNRNTMTTPPTIPAQQQQQPITPNTPTIAPASTPQNAADKR